MQPTYDYNQSQTAMTLQGHSENKRKYSRISYKKREDLVNMVVKNEQSIACAARRLGLKASTARMILNKYKKTGSYPMKTFRKPLKGICAKQALEREKPSLEQVKSEAHPEQKMDQPARQSKEQGLLLGQQMDVWWHYKMIAEQYHRLYYGGLPLL